MVWWKDDPELHSGNCGIRHFRSWTLTLSQPHLSVFLSPSAAIWRLFTYCHRIMATRYDDIWEQSREQSREQSWSDASMQLLQITLTHFFWFFRGSLSLPASDVKKMINFNLHTYTLLILVIPPLSQWHVHTSFCLFTCFPFVRLLSILVVQRKEELRILFVWKLAWWLSGEVRWGLSCLMPGPPRCVGTSLLRNVELRRKEKQREEAAGWWEEPDGAARSQSSFCLAEPERNKVLSVCFITLAALFLFLSFRGLLALTFTYVQEMKFVLVIR